MSQDVTLAAWHALTPLAHLDPERPEYVPPLQEWLGYDPIPGSDETVPWIWRDRLAHAVENSGKSAIVLSQRGSWSSPNPYNTMRFPRLLVEIWSEPTRAADQRTVELKDASDDARAVFEVVDKILHTTSLSGPGTGVARQPLWWPAPPAPYVETPDELRLRHANRVLGSARLGEPEFIDVSDGIGMVRAEIYYGVTMG